MSKLIAHVPPRRPIFVVALLAALGGATPQPAEGHPGDFPRSGAPIYLFRVTRVTYSGLLTFNRQEESGTVTVSHSAGRTQLPLRVGGLRNTAELQPGRSGVVGIWSTYVPNVPFNLAVNTPDRGYCAETVTTNQSNLGAFRRIGSLVRLEGGFVPSFYARGGYNGSNTFRCTGTPGVFDNLFPVRTREVSARVPIARLRGRLPITVVYSWDRSSSYGWSFQGHWTMTVVLQPIRTCYINRSLTRCRANAFLNAA
jgi:hypothetical protein